MKKYFLACALMLSWRKICVTEKNYITVNNLSIKSDSESVAVANKGFNFFTCSLFSLAIFSHLLLTLYIICLVIRQASIHIDSNIINYTFESILDNEKPVLSGFIHFKTFMDFFSSPLTFLLAIILLGVITLIELFQNADFINKTLNSSKEFYIQRVVGIHSSFVSVDIAILIFWATFQFTPVPS